MTATALLALLATLMGVALVAVPAAAADDAEGDNVDSSRFCEIFGGPSCPTSNDVTGLYDPCRCKDGSSDRCECVYFYQCDNSTGEYDEDGKGLLDIRKSDGCSEVEMSCCKINGQHDKREVPTPHPNYPAQPQPQPGGQCGVANAGGVASKVLNNLGGETGFGEFPWMVAILARGRKPSQPEQLKCGGALIAEDAVLTAAHCVQGLAQGRLRVRAGEWDRETESELYKHQDRGVREVVMHPDFYGGDYRFDAALLLLDAPVDLGLHVGTICLPESGATFVGERCIVTGWGKDKLEDQWPHRYLKRLDLDVVARPGCESALRTTALGSGYKLHPSILCAGGEEGKDACKGDGGSPLACPTPDGRYQVAGLVVWGVDCGRPGVPGLYASVAEVRGWIDRVLGSRRR